MAGETRTIGCSIGVAAYPRDAADAAGLFKLANVGVRTAKLAGGQAVTGTARLVQTPDP